MKQFIFGFFLLTSMVATQAQPKKCGRPKINLAAMNRAELVKGPMAPQAVSRLVRVYFRVFRNDNGTNAGASLSQIESEFAQLQQDFAPNNICFANMGVDFINNTQINTMLDPDVAATVAWLAPFLVSDCITIFYQANLATYGGNAYNIPNTFFSVARGNIGFARTISHEMGHALGLLHTFESVFGIERNDGTSCSAFGDRVCDTPADPYVWNGAPCFTVNGCTYTGTCSDLNGNSNYFPPYANIMSYWGTEGCVVTLFSGGQYARVNAYLSSDAGLIGTQSPSNYTMNTVTLSSGVYMLSAIFNFSTSGTVNLTNTISTSLQAQTVTLSPGFTAAPSSGYIHVKPATCSY